jgi:hypothetical protein
LRLHLVTSSGVTYDSTDITVEQSSSSDNYLQYNDLAYGKFEFTNCSLSTSSITGIQFSLEYPNGSGSYYPIKIVSASKEK